MIFLNFFNLLRIFTASALCANILNVRFTSITDTPLLYLNKLYLGEWNEGEITGLSTNNSITISLINDWIIISDQPHESDPATTDAFTRLQICEDISNIGIFAYEEKIPVDKKEIFTELKQPQYAEIFNRIYNSTDLQKYSNPYTQQEFRIFQYFPRHLHVEPAPIFRKDYVFICLLKREGTDKIVPFYVSKPYDLHRGFSVHRFVFSMSSSSQDIMLAERSADVYVKSDFNVELHYLELRKHHEPGIWIVLNELFFTNNTIFSTSTESELFFSLFLILKHSADIWILSANWILDLTKTTNYFASVQSYLHQLTSKIKSSIRVEYFLCNALGIQFHSRQRKVWEKRLIKHTMNE